MDTVAVNWWAVLVAALTNFVVGGLWYSKALFGKAWMRVNGFTEADLNQRTPAVLFGGAFVFCFLMAANLAWFTGAPEWGLAQVFAAAVAAGFGWATLGLGVVALFEQRPWGYIAVNGGYLTVSFAAMGLILGAWR